MEENVDFLELSPSQIEFLAEDCDIVITPSFNMESLEMLCVCTIDYLNNYD
jgi:hypothetical protein